MSSMLKSLLAGLLGRALVHVRHFVLHLRFRGVTLFEVAAVLLVLAGRLIIIHR